jgi:DNA (cytosine-5)-methyltransferase 1
VNAPRSGSLFSGTGQLDEAVRAVFGGTVAWHSQYEPPKNGKEDKVQFAARILARHWPTVPNLGDITKVCWQCVLDEHGKPDILTGGFPCTDISSAGQRAGLTPDTRSGLWNHFARAISVLRPQLVVIENVEGLLSAKADRGLGLDAEALEEEAEAGRILRALGAVLGDLATLGFDAEWVRVAASEVGAPHIRKRVFVLAWPAAADAADLGHERGWGARDGRPGPADSDIAPAHTCGKGLEVGRVEPDGPERGAAERSDREPAADTHGCGLAGHGELPAGRDALRQRLRDDADGRDTAAADAARLGHGDAGPAGERRLPASAVAGADSSGGGAAPADTDYGRTGEEHPGADLVHGERAANGRGTVQLTGPDGDREARDRGTADQPASDRGSTTERQADRRTVLNLRVGDADLDWGDYGPAIRRWESILGRPAPWPTDALGRLSPVFSEWMQGYPDGWVTCTPGPDGMSPASLRNAMLRALGNGVVPQQAEAALRLLHARAAHRQAAA